jgi:hypothetical protein
LGKIAHRLDREIDRTIDDADASPAALRTPWRHNGKEAPSRLRTGWLVLATREDLPIGAASTPRHLSRIAPAPTGVAASPNGSANNGAELGEAELAVPSEVAGLSFRTCACASSPSLCDCACEDWRTAVP